MGWDAKVILAAAVVVVAGQGWTLSQMWTMQKDTTKSLELVMAIVQDNKLQIAMLPKQFPPQEFAERVNSIDARVMKLEDARIALLEKSASKNESK